MRSRDPRRTFLTSIAAVIAGAPFVARAQQSVPTTQDSVLPGFLIIYRPGPKWLEGKPLSEQPLRDHGRYMLDLYRRGILHSAGGFGDDSGGAALLNASNLDEARGHAEADPAVVAQTFVFELHEWRLVPWAKLASRLE
jgi:uncharacterized protein